MREIIRVVRIKMSSGVSLSLLVVVLSCIIVNTKSDIGKTLHNPAFTGSEIPKLEVLYW